jgi:hypothetical protein
VQGIIRRHLGVLRPEERRQLVADIERRDREGREQGLELLGDEQIDAPGWRRFAEELRGGKETNKKGG